MGKNTRFVGLDVHAETIAVAVAEGRNQVRSLGTIANRPEAVRRLVGKLGELSEVKVCYEAGPTGYALYWQLTQLGVQCEVIAPSLVPMKASDRVKTDRRDAERLARCYQAGDLTAVCVPDAKHEALSDLVHAREATKADELRAKHRLGKYLLRYGQRPADDSKAWSGAWWQWVRALQLAQAEQNTTLVELIMEVDHQGQRIARFDGAIDRAVETAPVELRALVDALQALRGVAKLTAVTLATEFGCFSRFAKAAQAMSYTGVVPSEHSSGPKTRRSSATASPRRATRIFGTCSWSRPGTTDTSRGCASGSWSCRLSYPRRSPPSRGPRRSVYIAATGHCRIRANRARRSSRRSPASWRASSGPSASKPSASSKRRTLHDRMTRD
jgi:transposase